MGDILDMARRDLRRFQNSGGFETEITITPISSEAVTIKGLVTRHAQDYTEDGLPFISDNIHCSFSEKDLNDLGVTTRNSKGELIIKGWVVAFDTEIGSRSYRFAEPQANNNLGSIKVILEKYE